MINLLVFYKFSKNQFVWVICFVLSYLNLFCFILLYLLLLYIYILSFSFFFVSVCALFVLVIISTSGTPLL